MKGRLLESLRDLGRTAVVQSAFVWHPRTLNPMPSPITMREMRLISTEQLMLEKERLGRGEVAASA